LIILEVDRTYFKVISIEKILGAWLSIKFGCKIILLPSILTHSTLKHINDSRMIINEYGDAMNVGDQIDGFDDFQLFDGALPNYK
jgi:hypothetical protein